MLHTINLFLFDYLWVLLIAVLFLFWQAFWKIKNTSRYLERVTDNLYRNHGIRPLDKTEDTPVEKNLRGIDQRIDYLIVLLNKRGIDVHEARSRLPKTETGG